ncbi:hypothetical protein N656DRAFT_768553 [Canariomyces notabilis]|uniref:SRR1-like domain-containing protein n=1 Tax=Canariomyces notabilis TaxID=2074819 RepID=A0AAN6TDI0_9PEZI|nr:hypothetical protein N656DRAFT_768553 [Canariomyces arenarius]
MVHRPPFLGNRRLLPILKKIPYLDVEDVRRPWEEMPAEQRQQREEFVIESTMAAYHSDKAFYTRDAIRQLEEQLQAAERPRNRPEWRHRLLDRCWTPNRAWVKITDLDGIVHHRSVWIPGIVTRDGDGHASRNGRTHIRFRTIQELTMPDPDSDPAREPFVSDQRTSSVAYTPITTVYRLHEDDMDDKLTVGDAIFEQVTLDEMQDLLSQYRQFISQSSEWQSMVSSLGATRQSLKSVDNIVFFYALGMSDDSLACKRALFMLAVVTHLRDLVGRPIPIYVPAYDRFRKWNDDEKQLLHDNSVILVEANGELFLKINENAAVVSYRNWNPVKQVVADMRSQPC